MFLPRSFSYVSSLFELRSNNVIRYPLSSLMIKVITRVISVFLDYDLPEEIQEALRPAFITVIVAFLFSVKIQAY